MTSVAEMGGNKTHGVRADLSVDCLFSPTPLVGFGARSLDDRSLSDLFRVLPRDLFAEALVAVRAAAPTAVPPVVGPYALVPAESLGPGAEVPVPLGGALYLPDGWSLEHDGRRWRLVTAERRARSRRDLASAESLDAFFQQIARAAGERAVGCLVDGGWPAGPDRVGIEGLRSLARKGGLTMVETPHPEHRAGDDSLYHFADHCDSPTALGQTLRSHMRQLRQEVTPRSRPDPRIEQLERELRTTRAELACKERELEAAEQRLEEAEQRQRLVLDAVSHGAWDWHVPSGRVDFSPQWLEQFGYDTTGGPYDLEFWNSIVHPEDLPRKQQAIDDHFSGQSETVAVEKRLRTITGEYRWYLARGRVVERDEQGRPLRVVGIDTNISELKAAERARREAERLTQLAVEAGGLGYWHWEIDTDQVRYSRRERELLGLPAEGPVTLDGFWERVHPEDRQRLREYQQVVIDSDQPYETEFRVVLPDGTIRWIAGKGDKTYDDQTQRRLLVGMNWDITERRQSERRLRRLVDTAQVGIAFARADGRIVECNESLLNTLGYDRATFEREGLRWQQTHLQVDAMFDESRSSEEGRSPSGGPAAVGQFEMPLVRRDGSRVETLCSVRQLEEGGDEFVIFVVDLTPLKIAEEQLRRSEDKLRRAAEGAGFGMYELDFATGHISWSPEMRKLLGVSTDAEVPSRGSLIAEFIHQEDRDKADAALQASLDPSGDGRLQHEYRIVRPDGAIRWLLVRGSTVFSGHDDPDGRRPMAATGIVLDVTERKRVEQSLLKAQAEAEAASRSKSEFLANMSHEIRTPMTAILGYADLIAEQLSDADALEQIETIRRNGRFLLNIINDILDLSKIDAGRLEVHRQPCPVGQLITDVCGLMEVRVREKGLQLIVDFEGQIPETINTDPTRLRQVLVNLIGNAIKFTDEGSVEVVVRHDEAAQRLRIDVIDTGIGIPEDAQAELFAPFMQVDTAINRQFGGTGLGLAITRRLAEMLGGEVSVSSTLGEGSCFTVSIDTGTLEGVPRISPVLQIPQSTPPERGTGPIESRILVVDDSRDIRALASTLLKRAGADVTTAEGGQEAIDAVAMAEAEGRPFELIFMDVQMPGMDGPTAVSHLRAAGYAVPVVALTANAMQGDREKCLRQGYTDYLSKPLDIRRFKATLKKYLHH